MRLGKGDRYSVLIYEIKYCARVCGEGVVRSIGIAIVI